MVNKNTKSQEYDDDTYINKYRFVFSDDHSPDEQPNLVWNKHFSNAQKHKIVDCIIAKYTDIYDMITRAYHECKGRFYESGKTKLVYGFDSHDLSTTKILVKLRGITDDRINMILILCVLGKGYTWYHNSMGKVFINRKLISS